MQSKLVELKKYLDRVSADTGWYIMIDDHYGVLKDAAEICDYLSSRKWHVNPYCMWIKQDEDMHRRCVEQQPLRRQLTEMRGRGGWHICYCGVAEYTLPVFLGNIHAFSVCVAGFLGERTARETDEIAALKSVTPREVENLRRRYLGVANEITEQRLECYIGVVGTMLCSIFGDDPLLAQRNNAASVQQRYVLAALDYIDKHYTENICPASVSQSCNVSLSYLQHLFVQFTGEGIAASIRRKRLQYACELLSNTDRSVRNIALSSGFYDTDYFSVIFKRTYGVTPLKFRKR